MHFMPIRNSIVAFAHGKMDLLQLKKNIRDIIYAEIRTLITKLKYTTHGLHTGAIFVR